MANPFACPGGVVGFEPRAGAPSWDGKQHAVVWENSQGAHGTRQLPSYKGTTGTYAVGDAVRARYYTVKGDPIPAGLQLMGGSALSTCKLATIAGAYVVGNTLLYNVTWDDNATVHLCNKTEGDITPIQPQTSAPAQAREATGAVASAKQSASSTRKKTQQTTASAAKRAIPAPEKEFEVEKVLSSRICVDTSRHEFLVKWVGYPSDANSWEPVKNLNCPDKLSEFHQRQQHISARRPPPPPPPPPPAPLHSPPPPITPARIPKIEVCAL